MKHLEQTAAADHNAHVMRWLWTTVWKQRLAERDARTTNTGE